MEIENPEARSHSEAKITFKPVKLEEISPPSKKDLELMLMWNLKMFPFLLKNYDAIFEEKGHSNSGHAKIIHSLCSDFCPMHV